MLFKDDFSHYRTVYFIKQKSEVAKLIEKYCRNVKSSTSCSVVAIRTDNGREYVNNDVKMFIESHGIQHQRTVSFNPEQNGRAEREIRTLIEAARTMIHSKKLSLKYWAEAVNTAVYVLNRTGPSSIKGKTPYELWFKTKPVISHLRCFGSEVYTYVPKEKRRKWESKAERGIFVGYCDDTKGYRVWFPEQQKIIISRDVVFRENETPNQSMNGQTSSELLAAIPFNNESSSIVSQSNRTRNNYNVNTFTPLESMDQSFGNRIECE